MPRRPSFPAQVGNIVLAVHTIPRSAGGSREDEERLRDVAADLLNLVRRGPLGKKLFTAIAQRVVVCPVELVAMRKSNEGLEVYLTQRPVKAPTYAGLWHCPGSIQRHGETASRTLERLAREELGVGILGARIIGCFDNLNHKPGGTARHSIYLVSFDRDPECGEWFSVDNLPPNIVDHHRDVIIPAAIAAHYGNQTALERYLPTRII